jgi:hypothetical protein
MRRRISSLSIVSILAVLLVSLVASRATGVGAQDATPAPLGFELAPGVTAEDVAPPEGSPALFRLQIAAGVTFQASDGTDPSITLVYGETGTLTVLVEAPVTINRAGATGQPGETVAAGTEFEVRPGDYFVAPPNVAAQIRNDGTAPATLLAATIVPPQASAAGTPTS